MKGRSITLTCSARLPRARQAPRQHGAAVLAKQPISPDVQLQLADLQAAVRSQNREATDGDAASVLATQSGADVENVYLMAADIKGDAKKSTSFTVSESLEELSRLAETAGLEVVGSTHQSVAEVNPRTYLGSGKVQEVAADVRRLGVQTVIADDELTPTQLRSLEEALGESVRVADRTSLILDIFGQRAQSREGKLQVELAAATYQLPRLRRMWTHLERQSGAGRMRGMGETQREVDKRLLRDNIAALRRQIESIRSQRRAQRNRRKLARVPVVALVGYTNAGKSTLLNRLAAAGVYAEDTLFATLDPTTRRTLLPSGKNMLVSDTVGFIQKLPTLLVAAFRATLEELEDADVILHVVDASHPNAAGQSEAVFKVLEEIEVSNEIPMITVWNKLDQCPRPQVFQSVAEHRADTVAMSALNGAGLQGLQGAIEDALQASMLSFEALIPYTVGSLVNQAREHGVVRSEEYRADGVYITGSAEPAMLHTLAPYLLEMDSRRDAFAWTTQRTVVQEAAS